MKSAIQALLVAALTSSDAVQATAGPKWGDRGMSSPFEQFRNPNAEDEAVGSGAPIEPEKAPEEEKFQFENVMTAEEEGCYIERYTDVTNMTANEHYARIGEKQGRNIRCTNVMTGIMANRYLRRYQELGNKFGRHGAQSFKKAKEHWYNNGSKQIPPLSLRISYTPENPYKCSDYGGDCDCPGRIHFGHKKRQDSGDEITTFSGLNDWNTKTKWEEGFQLKITCDRHHFAKGHAWDNFANEDLQCFCEPFLTPEPYHCSDDGGDCQCNNGHVFYGEKFKHHGTSQVATFQEALDDGEYLVAGNVQGNIKCEPKSFVGHEIFEEYGENGCYCDDIGAVDITYIESEISWWTSKIEEKRIQEANARAQAEAEAARIQAAHDNSALQAELEAAKQRIKESEEAYARAQAEAQKKAAERAAQDKADAEAEAKAEAEREKQLAAEKAARQKAHEEALAAAEAAAEVAAKEKVAAQRRKLLEEAQKAKEEAIKAQVAATIAAQQEKAAILLAEQKAKHEADKRAQQAAMDEMKRLQEAEEKRRIAIEEAKKEQMIAAMQQAHADQLAAEAEAAKAASQKRLAQALEDQQKAYEAKMAAEAAERARIEKLKQEEEARKLAAKLAAEKAAEEAKKKAEEEEKKRKAAELAAHRQLIADEKAAAAEEARLAQEAQEQEAARAAAQQAAQKAAADLALAKTEADKQKAMAAQREAEEAQRVAQAAERAALVKKRHLEEDIRKKKLIAELAAKAAQEAEEKKLQAQADAADWKRQAEEAQEESIKQQQEAAAALAARKAELEAERQRNKAKHNAALKEQAETYRLASLAADEAHRAAELARKAKEEEQIAAHKRQMATRRDAFEKAFRNVWATGDTGVSLIHVTVPSHSDELIGKLYKKTMIADVDDVKTDVKKSWNNNGSIKWDVYRHRLTMISSDDRIAEVIEETALFMARFNEHVPFDLVVVPLATGSKEYIEWVKLQTLKKDDSAAFFNVQAEAEIKALTQRVGEE